MMELSILLAKIFGLWFLIIGIVFLWRRKTLMPIMEDFAGNRALIVSFALLELLAGISLVVSHNVWTNDFRIVITVISWWILIEGLVYLLLPSKGVKKMFKRFNKVGWFVSGSLISIVLGVYLLNAGFVM